MGRSNIAKSFFTTFILILCIAYVGKAQQITKISNTKYSYQDRVYRYSDMGSIFEQNFEADYFYKESVKDLKKSKNFSYTSLGLAAAGTVIVLLSGNDNKNDCNIYCFSAGDKFGFSLVLIAVPISITSLIDFRKGNSKRKEALRLFNANESIGSLREKTNEINLSISPGKIGLIMSF